MEVGSIAICPQCLKNALSFSFESLIFDIFPARETTHAFVQLKQIKAADQQEA